MRKLNRLHLVDLLDLRSSPTVLPSLLSTPVETMTGPSKVHLRKPVPLGIFTSRLMLAPHLARSVLPHFSTDVLLVDLAGVEPASRSPSL